MVLNGPCSPLNKISFSHYLANIWAGYGYLWVGCSFNKSLYILRCAGMGMLVDWLHCTVGCWELTLTNNSANKAKQVSLILMTCASLQTLNSSFLFALVISRVYYRYLVCNLYLPLYLQLLLTDRKSFFFMIGNYCQWLFSLFLSLFLSEICIVCRL